MHLIFALSYSILNTHRNKNSCFNVFFTPFDWIERKKRFSSYFHIHSFSKQSINRWKCPFYTPTRSLQKNLVYTLRKHAHSHEGETMGHKLSLMHYDRTRWPIIPVHLSHIHLLLFTQTLTELYLQGNPIGANGAQALADALRQNKVTHLPGSSLISIFFSSHRHSPNSTLTGIKSETMGHKL